MRIRSSLVVTGIGVICLLMVISVETHALKKTKYNRQVFLGGLTKHTISGNIEWERWGNYRIKQNLSKLYKKEVRLGGISDFTVKEHETFKKFLYIQMPWEKQIKATDFIYSILFLVANELGMDTSTPKNGYENNNFFWTKTRGGFTWNSYFFGSVSQFLFHSYHPRGRCSILSPKSNSAISNTEIEYYRFLESLCEDATVTIKKSKKTR